MQSIINGIRNYKIDEKTGAIEDILAFYPESYINKGQDFSKLIEEEIICDFIIKEKLGEGAFGSVRLGINKQTGEKVAIKILEKSKLVKYEDKIRIEREIQILKKLRHPNIVRLYSIIETEKQILLIMEYIKGQELFQYILLKKKLSEEEACYYFNQILSGIEYIHKMKIAHRDIKSENIIIEQNTKLIKIIDFGLSNTYGDKDEEILRSSCGSPLYAPPEMLKGDIYKGSTVDTWSMGVVLYFMICGYLPFQDEDNTKLYKKIIEGKYTIPMHVSTQGRELLYKMINVNPRKRINLAKIKRHQWIRLYSCKNLDINERVFDFGLNLNNHIIPIDEEIIDEMNIKYKLSKVKIRIDILMNKSNDCTTLYELLLKKKITEGKNSVADLKSDLFLKYIKDKKNLMAYYNNDIKKVIKERKNGYIENYENNDLNDKINLVKSQQDFYNKDLNSNNLFDLDKSPKIDCKFNIANNLTINCVDKNKNILNLKYKTNLENNNKKKSAINLTPFQRTKNKNKFNNINSVKMNKFEKQIKIDNKKSIKRNKINSLDKHLVIDKEIKSNMNDKKGNKIRKNISLDNSLNDKSKINKLLNNNMKYTHIENNIKLQNKRNYNYIIKENQNNTEIPKEKIKGLFSESKIIKTEENIEETTNEIIIEKNSEINKKFENNEGSNIKSNKQSIIKNENNDNSKSSLTTDDILKNTQTLDSFSLKNFNEENLFNNFYIENVNMFSLYPKKKNDKCSKILEQKDKFKKIQRKSKINKTNRINLINHNLQLHYKEKNHFHKKDLSENKVRHNSSCNVTHSEENIKYLENRKTEISPNNNKIINHKDSLPNDYIIHNNLIESRNPNNRKHNEIKNYFYETKNDSMIKTKKSKNIKIKKYNSIDDEFKDIKNKNLKSLFTVKIENNNTNLKFKKRRNNKICTSITKLTDNLPIVEIERKRKSFLNSQKKYKKLKLNEKSNDILIQRNVSIHKSKSLFSEELKQYSYSNNDKDDIFDISNIEKKKIKKFNGLNHKDNNKEKYNDDNKYIPFDLSCIFISSRKILKQKIVNICKKMRYNIKLINSYKFDIYQGDKKDNMIEINLPLNKLGIINIKKYRTNNIEQTNLIIKKFFSKINKI